MHQVNYDYLAKAGYKIMPKMFLEYLLKCRNYISGNSESIQDGLVRWITIGM